MATHDYVIDNGTGSAVRTDLNNVLQAILTNNSSSSEPSTTAAYSWWADTTNGVLKIRNSSNNGWVELFLLKLIAFLFLPQVVKDLGSEVQGKLVSVELLMELVDKF